MSSSISPRLWNAYTNVRIIGWADVLAEWNNSLCMPSKVETILENLKEACNPDSTYEPTLLQFLTFLNHEQAGIAWFLFEAITHRWMWATPRLDYVRDLVDEIENLDGYFPAFPGSPGNAKTIRQWITENLSREELDVIQMMPPLVNDWSTYTYSAALPPSPVASARAHYSYAQRPSSYVTPTRRTQPVAPVAPARKKVLGNIQFRIIRDSKASGLDDVITISKNDALDTYTMRYADNEALVKYSTKHLSAQQTIEALRKTLRFLTVDEMPFEYVQVTLPAMPSIMVKPENLSSQTRDLIYDSVEATMDNWPTSSF
jgi:hypothetical protein